MKLVFDLTVNFFVHDRANESMYHALGYGTIMFMQAMMTFDKVLFLNGIPVLSKPVDWPHDFSRRPSLV